MSNALKSIGMIFAGVLAAAAIVFTAGAAIPAIGAIVGAGGFSAAVGSTLAAVGLGTDTLLGSVVAGAVTSAGFGAATGGAIAAVTGGDIGKGLEMGALTGAVTGGITSGLSFDPGMGTSAEIASRGAAGASVVPGDVSVSPFDASSITAPSLPGAAAAPATAAAAPGGAAAATLAPAGAAATASNAATVTAGPIAPPPAINPANYTAPTLAAAPPTTTGGGLLSQVWDATADGQGGHGDFLGKVIGGIGQGLTSSQDATDAAKIGITRDAAARDATSANYAQPTGANGSAPVSGGGLIRAAATPSGLQKPTAAFNPTARWIVDPTTRRLVLVPATGTTLSTPTA